MSIINDQNQAMVDNQAFLHSLNTKGIEKAASAMTDFVRVKIREASFARRIIPPKPVSLWILTNQCVSLRWIRFLKLTL